MNILIKHWRLWIEKADFIAKLVAEHSPYINWIASEDVLSHMKHDSEKRTSGNYRDSKYLKNLEKSQTSDPSSNGQRTEEKT
ncbi:hypothetical protein AVEN_194958-1 [Araneus ventricosus]|uniref:Uncharacterized protein n=1 Tax=Araneus ventricosus TaxID=182803 RepID=A0A4Y2EZB2_ARAVE|nr:hypothetical protein AVEN_194958-1 [Araneus ventricosus]